MDQWDFQALWTAVRIISGNGFGRKHTGSIDFVDDRRLQKIKIYFDPLLRTVVACDITFFSLG